MDWRRVRLVLVQRLSQSSSELPLENGQILDDFSFRSQFNVISINIFFVTYWPPVKFLRIQQWLCTRNRKLHTRNLFWQKNVHFLACPPPNCLRNLPFYLQLNYDKNVNIMLTWMYVLYVCLFSKNVIFYFFHEFVFVDVDFLFADNHPSVVE